MECIACNREIQENTHFCRHCGATQQVLKQNEHDPRKVLNIVGLFYGVDMLMCLVIKFNDSLHELRYYLVFDTVNTILTIGFILYAFQNIKPCLRWNNFSVKRLMLYMVIAILSSIVVQYLVGMVNHKLFDEDEYYYFTFAGTAFPKLFMFLMIAVQPALVEELGYRGLIISQLNTVLDTRQVIFISAFIFALIHLSIFSMLWIIPFGIFWVMFVKRKTRYGTA